MPEVIISNVAKHHAYETAVAAQNAGLLKHFYTSFYSEKNPPIRHKLLRNILPGTLQGKVSNRTHRDLDEKLVKSFFFPEMLERTPLRELVGRYNMMNFKGTLYDLRVSMNDLNCDIFHGFEGAVLYSMRKAKKNGAIAILDQPIFYHQTSRAILVSEYERWGVTPPSYLYLDDVNIRRKDAEIKEADYIVVPTEAIAEDFRRLGKKAVVVQYGFDPERFSTGKKDDNVFRILFVGIVGFRKGVIYLLEAFKQLNLKNAELILISPIDKEFEVCLRSYEGLFKYIKSVSNDSLRGYYVNSSVFVFPSLVEGSAYVTYEAMACGLPIITTENAGTVTRDGQDGFVVPIRDIDALKERILYLYENEKKRKEMGESASEYVRQFTWERYHSRIEYLYNNLFLNKNK